MDEQTDLCIQSLEDGSTCGKKIGSQAHYSWTALDVPYHKFKCELENTPIGFLKMRLREVELSSTTVHMDLYQMLQPIIYAQWQVLEMYENWPVHIETPYGYEEFTGYDTITIRLTHKMEWLTRQEYVKKFGTEPPMSGPIKKILNFYRDHPNINKEWLVH